MTAGAEDSTGRLRSIQAMVVGIHSALVGGDLEEGGASADKIVVITSEMLEMVNLDRDHDREADEELVAALGVYRNAAFAYRKLVDAGGETDSGLATACDALIEQGHDHLRAYMDGGPKQEQLG